MTPWGGNLGVEIVRQRSCVPVSACQKLNVISPHFTTVCGRPHHPRRRGARIAQRPPAQRRVPAWVWDGAGAQVVVLVWFLFMFTANSVHVYEVILHSTFDMRSPEHMTAAARFPPLDFHPKGSCWF